jgi:hypothetical protein
MVAKRKIPAHHESNPGHPVHSPVTIEGANFVSIGANEITMQVYVNTTEFHVCTVVSFKGN